MKKHIISLVILLLLFGRGMSQSSGFSGDYLYENGVWRIFAVTTGDLDQDGDKDILFAEPDSSLLQWLRNDGNHQFVPNGIDTFPAIGVLVYDVDGDGINDILACSYNLNRIILYRNDGSGGFTPRIISDSVQHPVLLSAGDIDGDGDTDIAAATQDAGTGVVLLVNNGNLNFTMMQIDADSYSSTWTKIIDLDKDGDPDVVGNDFSASGGLIWYEQTGPLIFVKHLVPFPNAHGGAAGDIDGDGDIDLAAAACGTSIAWFENDGNCQFTAHVIYFAYNCAVSIAITDIDGDSHNDLAATIWGSSRIDWFKNDGSQAFTRQKICDTLVHPSDLCVEDINDDGYPDILTGSYTKKLALFENNGFPSGIATDDKVLPYTISIDQYNRTIIISLTAESLHPVAAELYSADGRLLLKDDIPGSGGQVRLRVPTSGLYILRIMKGSEICSHKVAFL